MHILIYCFIGILFGLWLWKRRYFYITSMKLPGPISFPFIGSIFLLMELIFSEEPLKILWKCRNKYSGLFRSWFGTDLYIIVIDPEDIESLSSSKVYCKSLDVQSWWKSAMGSGLVTKSGKELLNDSWKEHKKIIYPSMGINTNKIYYETVRRKCLLLEEDVKNVCDHGLVEMQWIIKRFCADATLDSFFGVDVSFRDGKRDKVFVALADIMGVIIHRTIKFWFRFSSIFYRSEIGKRQLEGTVILREFAQELFDKKIEQHNNNIVNETLSESAASELLMKAYFKKTLSADQVIEEFMNIFPAAGTAASGIKFAVLSLAMNRDCQSKAFQEIKEFYKNDRNAIVEFEHLNNFPYLEMCLKESLRFFSTGPITTRYANEDFEFKSKKLIIPKGTTFIVSSYLAHRNPDQWNMPEKYIPERFTPEETEKRHPYSYIPFGIGPRRCVGRPFSHMIMTACFVHLLRKFEFHSDWKINEIPLSLDVNYRSKWGYKVKVTERIWE